MHKRSPSLWRLAAFTAWTAMTFGQTPAMLTLHVKTPDGVAIQSAEVLIQSAQPSAPVRVWVRDPKTNKLGMRSHTPVSFVTRTDTDGQVQSPRAELEREFPS